MKFIYLLEPVLQQMRISKVERFIKKGKVLVDIGCDDPPVLLEKMKQHMSKCIGIDIAVKSKSYENVEILQQNLEKKIGLPSNSADTIVMLAVLEHMEFPKEMVQECFRILRKNGVLLVTVPSQSGAPVLDLFSFFRLVRPEMIKQHHNYFSKKDLLEMCKAAGFSNIKVESFEFGCNTFMQAVKS